MMRNLATLFYVPAQRAVLNGFVQTTHPLKAIPLDQIQRQAILTSLNAPKNVLLQAIAAYEEARGIDVQALPRTTDAALRQKLWATGLIALSPINRVANIIRATHDEGEPAGQHIPDVDEVKEASPSFDYQAVHPFGFVMGHCVCCKRQDWNSELERYSTAVQNHAGLLVTIAFQSLLAVPDAATINFLIGLLGDLSRVHNEFSAIKEILLSCSAVSDKTQLIESAYTRFRAWYETVLDRDDPSGKFLPPSLEEIKVARSRLVVPDSAASLALPAKPAQTSPAPLINAGTSIDPGALYSPEEPTEVEQKLSPMERAIQPPQGPSWSAGSRPVELEVFEDLQDGVWVPPMSQSRPGPVHGSSPVQSPAMLPGSARMATPTVAFNSASEQANGSAIGRVKSQGGERVDASAQITSQLRAISQMVSQMPVQAASATQSFQAKLRHLATLAPDPIRDSRKAFNAAPMERSVTVIKMPESLARARNVAPAPAAQTAPQDSADSNPSGEIASPVLKSVSLPPKLRGKAKGSALPLKLRFKPETSKRKAEQAELDCPDSSKRPKLETREPEMVELAPERIEPVRIVVPEHPVPALNTNSSLSGAGRSPLRTPTVLGGPPKL